MRISDWSSDVCSSDLDDERTLIELVISNAVGGRRMRLAIDATREATRCQAERTSPGFVVTHRNWRDGSFIAWLAQTVIADGRTIPAIASPGPSRQAGTRPHPRSHHPNRFRPRLHRKSLG